MRDDEAVRDTRIDLANQSHGMKGSPGIANPPVPPPSQGPFFVTAQLVITAVCVLLVSPVGLVLALLFARAARHNGDRQRARVFNALAIVAAVITFVEIALFGAGGFGLQGTTHHMTHGPLPGTR